MKRKRANRIEAMLAKVRRLLEAYLLQEAIREAKQQRYLN